MSEAAPPITVLMAVYNGAARLRESMGSILAQRWGDFELLVVNDGSTDASRDVALSFGDPRVRVIDQPTNTGLAAALNRGLAEARGEWVARADDDDLNDPRRLERQWEAVRSGACDLCFAGIVESYPDGTRVPGPFDRLEPAVRRWLCLFRNAYGAHPAVMYRRRAILDLGGYDPAQRAEDYDLWDRCAAAGLRFTYVTEPLVLHRIHPHSSSTVHADALRASAAAIRLRALRRLLPELTEIQAEGLGWLFMGYSAQGPAPPLEPALAVADHLIQRFLATCSDEHERRCVRRTIAASLARRLRRVGPLPLKVRLARRMLAAWARSLPGRATDRG